MAVTGGALLDGCHRGALLDGCHRGALLDGCHRGALPRRRLTRCPVRHPTPPRPRPPSPALFAPLQVGLNDINTVTKICEEGCDVHFTTTVFPALTIAANRGSSDMVRDPAARMAASLSCVHASGVDASWLWVHR